MGGGSKSASPPDPPDPIPTATDMSPEVEEARKRRRMTSGALTGYQSTLLTGPGGLGPNSNTDKKKLLGG